MKDYRYFAIKNVLVKLGFPGDLNGAMQEIMRELERAELSFNERAIMDALPGRMGQILLATGRKETIISSTLNRLSKKGLVKRENNMWVKIED